MTQAVNITRKTAQKFIIRFYYYFLVKACGKNDSFKTVISTLEDLNNQKCDQVSAHSSLFHMQIQTYPVFFCHCVSFIDLTMMPLLWCDCPVTCRHLITLMVV